MTRLGSQLSDSSVTRSVCAARPATGAPSPRPSPTCSSARAAAQRALSCAERPTAGHGPRRRIVLSLEDEGEQARRRLALEHEIGVEHGDRERACDAVAAEVVARHERSRRVGHDHLRGKARLARRGEPVHSDRSDGGVRGRAILGSGRAGRSSGEGSREDNECGTRGRHGHAQVLGRRGRERTASTRGRRVRGEEYVHPAAESNTLSVECLTRAVRQHRNACALDGCLRATGG